MINCSRISPFTLINLMIKFDAAAKIIHTLIQNIFYRRNVILFGVSLDIISWFRMRLFGQITSTSLHWLPLHVRTDLMVPPMTCKWAHPSIPV